MSPLKEREVSNPVWLSTGGGLWVGPYKSFPGSAAVSHISRKTSEMWGTHGFVAGVVSHSFPICL
jgi:hypothetical protein